MPSTDIMGKIDTIMSKAKNNSYTSQFEMDLEINHLIKTAHDGHLAFQLCSQSIFTYQIDMPLVSISTDGLALPQVYALGMFGPISVSKLRINMPGDAKLHKVDPDAVSPLVSINGTDVATYLESYASNQNLQDRDAQ